MIKIKVSYERPEELRKVLERLKPYVKSWKASRDQKRAFLKGLYHNGIIATSQITGVQICIKRRPSPCFIVCLRPGKQAKTLVNTGKSIAYPLAIWYNMHRQTNIEEYPKILTSLSSWKLKYQRGNRTGQKWLNLFLRFFVCSNSLQDVKLEVRIE